MPFSPALSTPVADAGDHAPMLGGDRFVCAHGVKGGVNGDCNQCAYDEQMESEDQYAYDFCHGVYSNDPDNIDREIAAAQAFQDYMEDN